VLFVCVHDRPSIAQRYRIGRAGDAHPSAAEVGRTRALTPRSVPGSSFLAAPSGETEPRAVRWRGRDASYIPGSGETSVRLHASIERQFDRHSNALQSRTRRIRRIERCALEGTLGRPG
jgi:hypothetical protein